MENANLGLGGFLVRSAGKSREFLVENPVGATSWNQPSIQGLRNGPFVFEDISHLCMFGVKDPRSRRALKRPVRYLTNSREVLKIVGRKCQNKHVHGPMKGLTNAHRSSSRWHTRTWGQAVSKGVESDAQTLEAYPAEDVEIELARTAIPDDGFHEEPHLEEAKVSEDFPNAVRVAHHAHSQKSGTSYQGVVVSRFADWRSQQSCDSSCA